MARRVKIRRQKSSIVEERPARCPFCDSRSTSVTRTITADGMTWRYRRCRVCSESFRSYEK